MVIPCLYLLLFTALRTLVAELPVNKNVPEPFLIKNRVCTTLVDIPEDWEPRAKQQPTGLIAYGTSCRRPVLVLHRPRKKSQVKRLGIFVVDGTGLEPVTSCTSSRCSTS